MNFLDALLGIQGHAANHLRGGEDEIDADNLHVSRTPTHYGVVEPTLESHLSGIDTAIGGLGNPPADPNHSLPYNSSGAFAWSSQVFCGGTWLGFAATEAGLPSGGSIRLGLSTQIMGKFTDGDAPIAAVAADTLLVGSSATLGHAQWTVQADGTYKWFAGATLILQGDATNGWNLQGKPLTNYFSGKSADYVSISSGIGGEDVLTQPTGATEGQHVRIKFHVLCWKATDLTTAAYATAEADYVSYDAGIGVELQLIGSVTYDVASLPAGISMTIAPDGPDGASVLCHVDNTTGDTWRARAVCWFQPPFTLQESG